jgi:hypothetical protein
MLLEISKGHGGQMSILQTRAITGLQVFRITKRLSRYLLRHSLLLAILYAPMANGNLDTKSSLSIHGEVSFAIWPNSKPMVLGEAN